MLAKITTKNQVTIPKKIKDQLPGKQYFEVELGDGVITLKPLVTYDTDLGNIRTKMKKLGLTGYRYSITRSIPENIDHLN